ncbi:MAG: hypothetical protein HYT78_14495 [Deltaproteobacteria bacterium]|nr:hypothetical protein [Deltaproteobacteria bacterium]
MRSAWIVGKMLKEGMDVYVLLVDDHAMFRAGIKALLEQEGRVNVVGEASTTLPRYG